MTIDTAHPNLCCECDQVVHKDKVLADQCRLMTAILGHGWGTGTRSKDNIQDVKEVISGISTEGQIVELDVDSSEPVKSIDLSDSYCCLEEDFVTQRAVLRWMEKVPV